MELKNQVTNLELSRKMNDLGFKQESLFFWNVDKAYINQDNMYTISYGIKTSKFAVNVCSAYTVAELGDMLPLKLHCASYFTIKEKWIDKLDGIHRDYFFNYKGIYDENMANGECTVRKTLIGSQSKNEANARAKMLIYLKENNLI